MSIRSLALAAAILSCCACSFAGGYQQRKFQLSSGGVRYDPPPPCLVLLEADGALRFGRVSSQVAGQVRAYVSEGTTPYFVLASSPILSWGAADCGKVAHGVINVKLEMMPIGPLLDRFDARTLLRLAAEAAASSELEFLKEPLIAAVVRQGREYSGQVRRLAGKQCMSLAELVGMCRLLGESDPLFASFDHELVESESVVDMRISNCHDSESVSLWSRGQPGLRIRDEKGRIVASTLMGKVDGEDNGLRRKVDLEPGEGARVASVFLGRRLAPGRYSIEWEYCDGLWDGPVPAEAVAADRIVVRGSSSLSVR